MTGSEDVTWRRAPHLAYVDDSERVVILDLTQPDSGIPRLLSGSAAEVWRLVEQPARLEAIVGALVRKYGVPRSDIEQEVRAFVDHLADLRILAPNEGSGEGDGLRHKHVV